MNKETAEEIQCGFEYLAFDDLTPISFAPLGRESQTWQWQFAVEFIYRLIAHMKSLVFHRLDSRIRHFGRCCNGLQQREY